MLHWTKKYYGVRSTSTLRQRNNSKLNLSLHQSSLHLTNEFALATLTNDWVSKFRLALNSFHCRISYILQFLHVFSFILQYPIQPKYFHSILFVVKQKFQCLSIIYSDVNFTDGKDRCFFLVLHLAPCAATNIIFDIWRNIFWYAK